MITRRTALATAAAAVAASVLVPATSSASVAVGSGVQPVAASVAPAATPATTTSTTAATWTTLRQGSRGPAVTALQQRLNSLGYWVGTPTGYYGTQTAQAVMALQKVAGLGRDGICGAQTKGALDRGVRPTPRSRVGHVIEIDKARQVMIVADNGRTTRIHNVSTGGEYRYYSQGRWSVAHTPTGSWTVYKTVPSWETGPLGSMYRSHYVVGGIAIHGVGNPAGVGARGASHGCIRTTTGTQDELIRSGMLRKGTRVTIY